jgi:hypothetical protein
VGILARYNQRTGIRKGIQRVLKDERSKATDGAPQTDEQKEKEFWRGGNIPGDFSRTFFSGWRDCVAHLHPVWTGR